MYQIERYQIVLHIILIKILSLFVICKLSIEISPFQALFPLLPDNKTKHDFLGGVQREYWPEMGYALVNNSLCQFHITDTTFYYTIIKHMLMLNCKLISKVIKLFSDFLRMVFYVECVN